MKLEISSIKDDYRSDIWSIVDSELDFDDFDQVIEWMKDNDFNINKVEQLKYSEELSYEDEQGKVWLYRLKV